VARDGAKARLLAYLTANVGRVVASEELREIAGISEWARRVRELRDDGYPIETHNDRSALRPGEYILVSAQRRDGAGVDRQSERHRGELVQSLRAAARAEQLECLTWLVRKYPSYARRLVDETP
jgi:biotin operon repressor